MPCVVMALVVLFVPRIPWTGGFTQTCLASTRVFDALALLNEFTGQVAVSRKEMLGCMSGPSGCPVPGCDLILSPRPPFLVIKDPQTQTSGILVEPHVKDDEFREARVPFFCRSGHPVITVDQFGGFVGHFLPQEANLELPRITGREQQEVARAKKVYCCCVRWMGLE